MILDFDTYIAERTQIFTGREWVFREIDYWLEQPNASRYYLLTGEPGSGKSAVAARLAQFSAGDVIQPSACRYLTPGFLRAVHFCSTTASNWIDPRNFARSISLQLAKIDEFKNALMSLGDRDINIDVQIQAGNVESGGSVTGVAIQNLVIQGLNGQEAFNRTVLDPLKIIYDAGFDQPIQILIDSLDEALASSTEVKIIDLLEGVQDLDSRVLFILTSRSEPRVEIRFQSANRLSLSDPTHKDDNNRDIAEYVKFRFQQDNSLASKLAGLPPAQAASLATDISSRADGNFQYVAFLLNAVASGQQSLDSPTGLPVGLDGLYYESLRRVVTLGSKDWTTIYQPFLGVLSVAREPLTLKLLETYTGSVTSLFNVYTDLIQFIEDAPASPPSGEQTDTEECYRLYHQSVIDFLHKRQLLIIGNKQNKTLPNIYYVEARDWHARIVASCAGTTGEWSQVDWSAVAPYTLRHLVAHLYQLCQANDYRQKLHSLLETRSFTDQHLARVGKPYMLLDDFRLALNLALEHDDLAQVWRHIKEYRRIVRNQLGFDQLVTAVESGNTTGDYVHATERTALYGYMPNSQALARLWIAWNAAASGHMSAAEAIIKRALERLPPRGTVQLASPQAGGSATPAVEDAIDETLQRLLIRITQTAEMTAVSQDNWLRQTMSPWPPQTVEATVGRLSESLTSWGDLFDAGQKRETMESLFQELQARGGRLDADMASTMDRYTIYFFQRRLAAGLFNSRPDPHWLEYVKKSVALIALDDYPSYREVALAWVAAAALAHEDPVLARKALATVLGGMFRPSPGFWGDMVAAAIDGMGREKNQEPNAIELLSLLEEVEATGEQGIDPSIDRKMSEILQWRRMVGLPEDPWSFNIRRHSAVAAVLYRRGDLQNAKDLLQQASAEPYEGSYAGFRALARLSLSCRWLEWDRLQEAVDQTSLAETDAKHVRDKVLREERLDLVSKVHNWIAAYGPDPDTLPEEEALAQLQRKSGLERGLFIEFLSALWFDNAPRLKRLLPHALDEATTADAVMGRLLGTEQLQARPGGPFLELVKTLQVYSGIENV